MKSLADQSLLSCNRSSVRLTESEINSNLCRLDSWVWAQQTNIDQIIKTYNFKNFIQAQQFTNRIANLAEQENHHPEICLKWGQVSIIWWTHDLKGLFINDFIMAAKCDETYAQQLN